MSHPLRYYVEIESWTFQVREARGKEHISEPWELELDFVLEPEQGIVEDFDPDEIVKKPAVVSLRRGSQVERKITGLVLSAKLSATATGTPEVSLTIAPRLRLLAFRQDVRIHRNLTVPQIVTEVCEALGVTIDNRLQGTYESRPYCVQWRETDLDYVSRLLEDEGIHYFFTEEGAMVLGDHVGAYDDIPGSTLIPHRALAGADMQRDAVFAFGRRAALRPGKVTLRDWNVDHPSLDMDASAPTDDQQGPEWYDFPGEYDEPGEGTVKAQLHAEAFAREAAAAKGTTTVARMYPGACFELEDEIGNRGGRYVVRAFEHDFRRTEDGFTALFDADPAELIYRPARDTHVPRILNPHTGVVCVSYPGEDIYCDHLGRVKIHFHWDRLRPYDDDCSDWVPVIQDNTGGSSAIPREGWEMLVHFMEGDPDRPVVLGRVYNGEDRFIDKLPTKKTRSALHSLTTPSREGANTIRFEDFQAFEHIFVHAEKDQHIEIANDLSSRVGHSDVEAVKNDETVNINGNATWKVGSKFSRKVGSNQTWKVGGNREFELSGHNKSAVTGNRTIDITGNVKAKVDDSSLFTADKLEETFSADLNEEAKLTHETNITDTCTLKVGGNVNETIKGAKVDGANIERLETITGNKDQIAKGEHQIRVGKKRTTTVTGTMAVKSGEELALTGAKKFKSMSPTSTYTAASQVTLKVGDTVVTMKDGLIKVDAPQEISLLVAGPSNQAADKAMEN